MPSLLKQQLENKLNTLFLPDDARLGPWLRQIFTLFSLLVLGWLAVWFLADGTSTGGNFMGQDFPLFWSASKLTLEGRAADAYDPAILGEVTRGLFPKFGDPHWIYPPSAFALYWPLALLPYFLSWFLFVSATAGALCLVTRRIVNLPSTVWITLTGAATLENILYGQNGSMNAALLGFALYAYHKKPVLAGIALGLLTSYKPHLTPLVYLLLLLGGQWKALLSAAATATAIIAASTFVLGPDIWQVWQSHLRLEEMGVHKMASLFSAAINLGLGLPAAAILHGIGAVAALGICLFMLRSTTATTELKAATVAFATLLLTPYVFFYDHSIGLVGLAFWMRHIQSTGWRRHEYMLMIALWCMPFCAGITALHSLPIGPVFLLAALYVLLTRERKPVFTPSVSSQ